MHTSGLGRPIEVPARDELALGPKREVGPSCNDVLIDEPLVSVAGFVGGPCRAVVRQCRIDSPMNGLFRHSAFGETADLVVDEERGRRLVRRGVVEQHERARQRGEIRIVTQGKEGLELGMDLVGRDARETPVLEGQDRDDKPPEDTPPLVGQGGREQSPRGLDLRQDSARREETRQRKGEQVSSRREERVPCGPDATKGWERLARGTRTAIRCGAALYVTRRARKAASRKALTRSTQRAASSAASIRGGSFHRDFGGVADSVEPEIKVKRSVRHWNTSCLAQEGMKRLFAQAVTILLIPLFTAQALADVRPMVPPHMAEPPPRLTPSEIVKRTLDGVGEGINVLRVGAGFAWRRKIFLTNAALITGALLFHGHADGYAKPISAAQVQVGKATEALNAPRTGSKGQITVLGTTSPGGGALANAGSRIPDAMANEVAQFRNDPPGVYTSKAYPGSVVYVTWLPSAEQWAKGIYTIQVGTDVHGKPIMYGATDPAGTSGAKVSTTPS